MAWVFFQVFLAFGVGVAIVWWTWPTEPKPLNNDEPNITAPNAGVSQDNTAENRIQ